MANKLSKSHRQTMRKQARARAKAEENERILFDQPISEIINQCIERAETATSADDKEVLFLARSKCIKQLFTKFNEGQRIINHKFHKELNFSKENIFPKKWMTTDKKINTNLERFPLLILIMNEIFNRNRRANRNEIEEMLKLSGGHMITRGDNQHPASVFVADKALYQEIAENIGFSPRTVQKYIRHILNNKLGIFETVRSLRHNQQVVCDGYFNLKSGTRVKVPLIKKNAHFKKVLRDFKV